MFDKEFVGQGESISPTFLMSYLFEYCGIKGNEYNQYLTDYTKDIKILNPVLYEKNNICT